MRYYRFYLDFIVSVFHSVKPMSLLMMCGLFLSSRKDTMFCSLVVGDDVEEGKKVSIVN